MIDWNNDGKIGGDDIFMTDMFLNESSQQWDSIYEDGTVGSEGGIVLADEEYCGSCRITLEKCESYYAITCGVYGSMVHTAFCNEQEAQSKYDAMKKELQEFIDTDMGDDARYEFYEAFTSKY